MDGMATSVLDRVVRWNLDFDGDIYGDERERLRWYEGIATAAVAPFVRSRRRPRATPAGQDED